LSPIGSSPNENAATLTGNVLNLEPASIDYGGVITTGTQTFAGEKTFNNTVTVTVGDGDGNGIYSTSSQGYGVYGSSNEAFGVYGNSPSSTGVYGNSDSGYGVQGNSASGVAIYGNSTSSTAIQGASYTGTAVYANSDYGTGLVGISGEGIGVSAYSTTNIGLQVNGNGTIAIDVILGNSNKGLVINSGTSSTGNFIELAKNSVNKLVVNQEGELTATKLIKEGGTGLNALLDDGNTIALSAIAGATNLSTSQTSTNFTINSDTGNDAIVPLGNGLLAGATSNDYTTTEKNKLAAIQGTNTGDNATNTTSNAYADARVSDAAYDATSWNGVTTVAPSKNAIRDKIESTGLQEITNINASTTNPINVNVTGVDTGVYAFSPNGIGVNGYSQNYIGVRGYAETGIGVNGYSETGIGGSFETEGTTANIANFKKAGVIKAFINNAGELTAQKLKKDGGSPSQILAADGSVITQGNNITITGGVISSVGGSGGGGSTVNYYLNGGTSQGTFGGVTYYEFSKTAVIGTGADFNISSNGYIASFITDVADPSLLLIPIGNWIIEFYFSANSAGGSPSFYVELYKVSATNVFSPIANNSGTPEGITNGDVIDAYFTTLSVPETVLAVDDRLAIRVFVNASGKTITLHTQDETLCEVITTFTNGLTALNGLQAQVQNFSVGTAGTDFDINSSGSVHTFNLPSASATARGVVTIDPQTFAGDKTFTGTIGASNLSGTNTGDQNLQEVVTKGNAITVPTTKDKGIDITLSNNSSLYQNGIVVTVPQQTGSNPSPDAFVAVLNGQNPGTLSGSPVGFLADVTGTDNYGFLGYLTTGASTSVGSEMRSFDSHTGNLYVGAKYINDVRSEVFTVSNSGAITSGAVTASTVNGYAVSGVSTNGVAGVFMTTNGANIAEFKTANVSRATVSAGGVFSGTGLKASAQTASTIASFDAFQNVVSLTTANGYPTLTELKSLVGVSATAIQTQLDAKANITSQVFLGTPSLPTGTIGVTQTAGDNSTKLATTAFVTSAVSSAGVQVSPQDTFGTASIATVTAAEYAAFVTAGTISATTLYFITA
jgi:hypothetical protein